MWGRKRKQQKSMTRGIMMRSSVTAAVLAVTLVGANAVTADLPEPLHQRAIAADCDPKKNPFQDIYYYEEGRQERYEAYQKQYPKMAVEDVVWRVNAELDRPFYSQPMRVKDTTVLPVIVNKYHGLAADYVPANLEKLPSGKLATKETCIAYRAMAADARKQGYSIHAISAYRSYALQNRLYQGYLKRENGKASVVDTYSARPGYSEHQTGRAIDLSGSFGSLDDFEKTKESKWVGEYCYQYGFIVRYQKDIVALTGYKYEPWHITYVGKEVSQAMHDLGITCLEEYVVKYIDHKPPAAV